MRRRRRRQPDAAAAPPSQPSPEARPGRRRRRRHSAHSAAHTRAPPAHSANARARQAPARPDSTDVPTATSLHSAKRRTAHSSPIASSAPTTKTTAKPHCMPAKSVFSPPSSSSSASSSLSPPISGSKRTRRSRKAPDVNADAVGNEVIVVAPSTGRQLQEQSLQSLQDQLEHDLDSLLVAPLDEWSTVSASAAHSLVRSLVTANHDVRLWLRASGKLPRIVASLARHPLTKQHLCAVLVLLTSDPKNIAALDKEAVASTVDLLDDIEKSVVPTGQASGGRDGVGGSRRRRRKKNVSGTGTSEEPAIDTEAIWRDIELPSSLQLAKHYPGVVVSHALATASFDPLFVLLLTEGSCIPKLCQSVCRDSDALIKSYPTSVPTGSSSPRPAFECCPLTSFRLSRCLSVLENIAQSHESRQVLLLAAKPSPIHAAIRLCHFSLDHDLFRNQTLAHDAVVASVRFLTNVSNENKEVCSGIAALAGPDVALQILHQEFLQLSNTKDDHDLITYAVGFLINCVECHDLIRQQLLHHSFSDDDLCVSALLVGLLLHLVPAWASESDPPPSLQSQMRSRTNSKLNRPTSGWDELQARRMVCGYTALLLGCLCIGSIANTRIVFREMATAKRIENWLEVLDLFASFTERLLPGHEMVQKIFRVHEHLQTVNPRDYGVE